MSGAPSLSRHVFKTSRVAEFCSQKELVNQTGHAGEDWPLVVLKELVDNALDSTENARIAPVIEITVSKNGIAVADNGLGIAPETVANILDYTARVSSNEAYVSPTRGAQGNALKTVLAMLFALDGSSGETVIESHGTAHKITFSVDPIRQEPRITRVCEDSLVKIGTRITVSWPVSASSILDEAKTRFLQIAEDYIWINPHLTLTVRWSLPGADPVKLTFPAADHAWNKWLPSDPTSPHWYDEPRFARLIANNIARAQDRNEACRTVRDFVGEFRGLSGTAKAKAICDAVNASRMSLADFYGDGDTDRVRDLLKEMCNQSRPIKPRDLGFIGEAHLRAKFESAGAAPESFRYKRTEIEHDGVPYLIEAAIGYCPEEKGGRRIITGINWSRSIGVDPFRNLGYGTGLGSFLTAQRCDHNEPIIFVMHIACPRVEYLDRGKSSVELPAHCRATVLCLLADVTAKWTRQRKAEERDRSARLRRREQLTRPARPMSIKEAAASVMQQAYMAASAHNTLPANPRQIMYAARPKILGITGKDNLDDQYFCQTLLNDYIREHQATCSNWNIAWDDRGHFVEPHTGKRLGLGTLAVRNYLAGYANPSLDEAGFAGATIETYGPECRYGAILYIEKEGFMPLLDRATLAEKFDISIMSCKGMSVTAARTLIDRTCALYGIPVLILHDFDVSGFSIASTLCNDTRRFSFKSEFKTIDLGLRLDDVNDLELESEPVALGANKRKISDTLCRCGAADDEIRFLLGGRRVELNAMTSDQFIAFVERKLTEAGIAKVVPSNDQLKEAYRLFSRSKQIKEAVEKVIDELDEAEVTPPDDLDDSVRAYLAEHPDEPWEDAVRHVVGVGGAP